MLICKLLLSLKNLTQQRYHYLLKSLDVYVCYHWSVDRFTAWTRFQWWRFPSPAQVPAQAAVMAGDHGGKYQLLLQRTATIKSLPFCSACYGACDDHRLISPALSIQIQARHHCRIRMHAIRAT